MQTTEIYTHVDPSIKLEALESVVSPKLRSGRFKATDELIASLKTGNIMRSKKKSIWDIAESASYGLCIMALITKLHDIHTLELAETEDRTIFAD